MSRVGKKPIDVPKGVEVKIEDGHISVKGPKGTLKRELNNRVKVVLKDSKLEFSIKDKTKESRALFGLTRALVANMVKGVTEGFQKLLELSGVGYRASKQGKKLVLQMGYSHPIEIDPPDGIDIQTEGLTKVKVNGIDRELVGQVAADIKKIRPVEPYKAKGIKYAGERVRRKAGKAAKAMGAA